MEQKIDQLIGLLKLIFSNEITAFLFVFSCAVGLFVSVAIGYGISYQAVVGLGAY